MKTRWINVAKCAAIIAVIVDHTVNILYTDQRISQASFFSVSLFILLMGITTYWSYDNSSVELRKKVIKRLFGILVPYTAAVFICDCIYYHSFNWGDYLNKWLHFEGPNYYVLLYVQLLIVSPVMFYCLKKKGRWGHASEIMLLIVILLAASWTTKCSNIAGIYGGGGKLAGGTYLICIYAGMLFGKYEQQLASKITKTRALLLAGVFTAASIALWKIRCSDQYLLDLKWLGGGLNPPGSGLILYAMCIMFSIYFWDRFIGLSGLDQFQPVDFVLKIASYIGTQTLYIFLYHIVMIYFLKQTVLQIHMPLAIRAAVSLMFIVGCSILLGIVLRYLKKHLKQLIRESYQYKNEQS